MGNDIAVVQAIIAIDSSADVRLQGDEYDVDTIKIDFTSTEISRSDIKTKMVELQAEHDAQEYARNRAADYPNMGDQMDKIYHDGLTKWKSEMVDPVKTKWPKDNSGPVE